MDQTPDVTAPASSAEPTDVAESSPESPTPDVAAPSAAPERTSEQMFRELQRKMTEQKTQLDNLYGYLLTQAKPQPSVVTGQKELTDDELWTAAQGGDRDAFVVHQQRIAQREYAKAQQQQNQVNIIEGQLRALFGKYPTLRDASHPLTQHVNRAYQLYVKNGYPADKATMLEAAKTAIADHPELIAEMQGSLPAKEFARNSSAQRAQTGTTGVAHNRTPGTSGKKLTVSPEELALARRMGLSPEKALKAKENFLKRHEAGQSQLSPSITAVVNQEEF